VLARPRWQWSGSFCELDPDGKRQRAHYHGLPVDFIAEAISTGG
jgi:fatty acid CoA ligase FadD9